MGRGATYFKVRQPTAGAPESALPLSSRHARHTTDNLRPVHPTYLSKLDIPVLAIGYSYLRISLAMADPLSVAGLAAGLVSLGLQVCGGVITYLDALDCREQDLVSLRQYHSSVHQTLQVVEASLGQLQQAHQGAADAARSCLDACHTELKGLETLLAELTSGTQPAGSGLRRRDKFKQEGKKLLYPFSRPKLEQLEARLQNANKALQLALQALGL